MAEFSSIGHLLEDCTEVEEKKRRLRSFCNKMFNSMETIDDHKSLLVDDAPMLMEKFDSVFDKVEPSPAQFAKFIQCILIKGENEIKDRFQHQLVICSCYFRRDFCFILNYNLSIYNIQVKSQLSADNNL